MSLFIVQTIIMLLLTILIFYLIFYNKSIKLEKRISKYTIPLKDNGFLSLFDRVYNIYYKLLSFISNKLKKIKVFVNYSRKYNKYVYYDKANAISSIDFVANKIIIGLAFTIIMVLARIIENKIPSYIDVIVSLLLGFYILDIYLKITDYFKKKKIEEDLLNAIIIMNNAFRSGRSMIQAIEIVSQELTGPISQEFKKMHLEIRYGLSLEVVFDRFSKRVVSDEVSYITSSLSILNKTGGNIIKVFSSIEKMLFNKRKLKQEMKSLTSSANMISKLLLVMPFVFVIVITILKNDYFKPLFNSTEGNILLGLMIIIYASYAYLVNRIMKVRMN